MCLRKTDSTGTIRRYKVQFWCTVKYRGICNDAQKWHRNKQDMTKKVLQNLHTTYVPEVLINSKHVPKRELSQEARKLHVPGLVSLLSDIVQEKKSEQQKHLVERKMGSRWEWWQHYQLHRRRGCPYRSGRQVINRVRNDNIVAKITIHCKGNDPSWGMPAVTAGRWIVLALHDSLLVRQQKDVCCHDEDPTNNPVPNSFQKDTIIIDNLGGRNIFPTAWKHNKCQGLLSWQSTQQSPAAEENPRH